MTRLQLLAEASQARKDAEAANRVKDVFFASITHELRSPLNACTMWLLVLALSPAHRRHVWARRAGLEPAFREVGQGHRRDQAQPQDPGAARQRPHRRRQDLL